MRGELRSISEERALAEGGENKRELWLKGLDGSVRCLVGCGGTVPSLSKSLVTLPSGEVTSEVCIVEG